MKNVNKLPVYPPDHLLGMRVPLGGSSCKSCEYVRGQTCKNKIFQKWKGDDIIPAPVDEYCCDMYEPEDKIGSTRFEDVGL